MSGIETLVVGYRPGDRRIHEIEDKFGLHFVAVRNCIGGCGYPVYFNSSGIDAARARDCQVICDQCMNENRADVIRAL